LREGVWFDGVGLNTISLFPALFLIYIGKQVGFREGSGESGEWVLVKPGSIGHDEYTGLLARSTFALSPPGT
jgi:hypothetical protein